jgi:hypothetical protein
MAEDFTNLFSEEEKPAQEDFSNLFAEEEAEDFSGLFEEQTSAEFAAGASMDFAESLLGVGDEAGAFALSVSDFFDDGSWNWAENLTQARETLDTFEAENPALSGAITAAGVAGSLLIPGGAALKLAQTGSKLNRAMKIGAVSSVEGAAYGALSGREEEGRIQGALLGGAIGGVGGLGVSMLLRNSDEIAAMAKADDELRTAEQGHISGTGFVSDAADQRSVRDISKPDSVSGKKRGIRKVLTDEEYDALPLREETAAGKQGGISGFANKWVNDVRHWVDRNVGERAGRLLEDAEWMHRTARQEWVGKIEDKLAGFDDMVSANPQVSAALQNLGRPVETGKIGTWEDVYRAVGDDKELRTQVEVFQNMYKDLKALDAPGRTTFDWIHTSKMANTGRKTDLAKQSDYMGPARAMIEYADEVTMANSLAERFGIKMHELPTTSKVKDKSKKRSAGIGQGTIKTSNILESVLKEIKVRAKAEGASDAVANNLDDALRTVFVSSKAGGDAAGAIGRKVTSAANLGNPMTAYLNVSEWMTPMFQNGVIAWGKQVPKMLTYALAETYNSWNHIGKYGLPKIDSKGLTPDSMGLGDQFMGEVASEASKTFGGLVDAMTKFVYNKGFVTMSNKTGQYAQLNSAINRGRALANSALKGNEKALAKLRKHDGMRGLSEAEFDKTMKALASGDKESGWVRNFAGASLNMWQPVSASALPKGMADVPDARIMYSMITYMNRQANAIRTKIGDNLIEAHRRGLNTPEGREALKEATMNSAKYTAVYGVGAGLWERHRTSMDPSRDVDMNEVLTADGLTEAATAQIVSNVFSGMVDIRSDEYGGRVVDMTPAPLDYANRTGSGLVAGAQGMLAGENVFDPTEDNMREFYRMLQGQPGFAAVDKINRVANDGERLFVQPKD